MKILLVSGEVHPYSKTGGLGDMVGALARALAAAGHQVGVVTPLYAGLRAKVPDLQPLGPAAEVVMGWRRVPMVVQTLSPEPGLTMYFVDHPGYFERPALYGEHGGDYPDNAERFVFFSLVAARLAVELPWRPEVVHVHDWQAGLVPILLQHQRLHAGWRRSLRTVMTIHNLAYQGLFPGWDFALTNLPADYFNLHGVEFYGQMNCLKAGIAFADAITTVSPRYAREITTPEYGCGLDALLRARAGALTGILNGVDYEEWKTSGNRYLPCAYSARQPAGKGKNKLALQQELDLPVGADTPLFGSVTRLTDQKGVDLTLGALEEMLGTGLQYVLLGSGSPVWEEAFRDLARRFPRQVAVRIGFDPGLSHRIEAGSDFYLMPSKFEPCGLNQLYSLRYGAVPIVRATGGLDDSVVDIAADAEHATGIKFTEYAPWALAKAIRKALALYAEPALLKEYRRNGMLADFSWDRAVAGYLRVYTGAAGAPSFHP